MDCTQQACHEGKLEGESRLFCWQPSIAHTIGPKACLGWRRFGYGFDCRFQWVGDSCRWVYLVGKIFGGKGVEDEFVESLVEIFGKEL